MKALIYGLILTCCLACTATPQTEATTADIRLTQPFDQLIGQWARSNDAQGKQTFEHWRKVDSSHYQGLGFTMEGPDTTWQEDIHLQKEGGTWRFMVTGQGESQATVFTITQRDAHRFVCENPAHDFPQKIAYTIAADSIAAVISGGETHILFAFRRMK